MKNRLAACSDGIPYHRALPVQALSSWQRTVSRLERFRQCENPSLPRANISQLYQIHQITICLDLAPIFQELLSKALEGRVAWWLRGSCDSDGASLTK